MDKIYQDCIDKKQFSESVFGLAIAYDQIISTSKKNDQPIPDEAIRLKEIILDLMELFPDNVYWGIKETYLK